MAENYLVLLELSHTQPPPPFVQQVLSHWPAKQRPTLRRITLSELVADGSALDRASAAWVLLDAMQDPNLYEVMATLQDQRVPSMLTRGGESAALGSMFQDGAVVGPMDSNPGTLCAMLMTLCSQTPTIRELTAENHFIRTHQGQLSTQMDKIDEELRLAAQLQREFLPAELPKVKDVEFQVLFRPAGYVSGDIYDVVRLDERHVGLFVADAVGHGVPAALLTMYIKRCLRTKEIDSTAPRGYRIIQPDEALAKLNHDMVEQNTAGQIRFATACYGIIDCETREFTCARAGHPFPMILRGSGETETMEPDGGMLGVFPEETFELAQVTLQPGDRVLFYSDGFEMAFAEQDKSGRRTAACAAEYTREFQDLAQGSLASALQRLDTKLNHAIGSLNQLDDLTVVAMGIAGTPESAASAGHAIAAAG